MKEKRELVRLLAAYLPRMAPPERAAWTRAMQSEIDHIEDVNDALGFAVGCALASIGQALVSARAADAARLIAALALTAGGIWQACLFWSHAVTIGLSSIWSQPLHLSLFLSGILWIGAALALMQWKPRRFAAFGALALGMLGYQQLGVTTQIQACLAGWEGFGFRAMAIVYFAAAIAILLARRRVIFGVAAMGLTANLINWLSLNETASEVCRLTRTLDTEGSLVLVFAFILAAVFGWSWRRKECRGPGDHALT